MSAESEYSDLLDRLADTHQARIAAALQELESRISALMATAPLSDGNLFDLQWALAARAEIRSIIDEVYLVEVQASIRQYRNVSASALAMLQNYGDFINVEASVITQLQRLSFQGFEALASEYLDVLATEVYQSTLTGRAFNESVKNLSQSINGIYIRRSQPKRYKKRGQGHGQVKHPVILSSFEAATTAVIISDQYLRSNLCQKVKEHMGQR